ncbi:MAG: DUF4097 family beta strand repeat protein [Spirochaetales bacterium]|nr:DUF4097 family beta strand repeat protein [Spirochaetales bacterium]
MKKIVLFTIYSCLSFILYSNSNSEEYRENLNYSGIGQLNISMSSGNLEIVTEDREDIYLYLKTFKNGPMIFIDKGNKTKIDIRRSTFKLFSFYNGDVKLMVVLPKKYTQGLELNLSSGDISAKNLVIEDFNISLSSGSLFLDNIITKNADFNASSGSMDITNLFTNNTKVGISSGSLFVNGFTGNLTGRLSSGDVDLYTDKIKGDIDFKISSGDFNLFIVDKNLDAKFELKTSSGSIKVKYPVTIEDNNNNKLYGYTGSGKTLISVKSSSGNIFIE